jgi:3-deoxy-D-manno-octulosonate 8-phosphate phosphatase (KDO 8-P phosphatase)
LVIEQAHYCTERSGGRGAVREACDLILHAKGQLSSTLKVFHQAHD